MAETTVTRRHTGTAASLSIILDSPELTGLIDDLEALRWTGRKGYPVRSLVGACLVKHIYAIPTWSRTAGLIAEHHALQAALGGAPSVYACYRFAKKLRDNRPVLENCLTALTASLRRELSDYGQDVAIDASDLPAYANGQRFLSKHGPERERFSDPDASWGHRSSISTRKGGGFYGYKIHAAVCVRTELPMAWRIETAKHHESQFAVALLDAAHARGFQPQTCAMDKAYDSQSIHDGFEQRDCHPITAQIRAGNQTAHDDVPTCEHGRWTFAGADFKRKATKWRCPATKYTPGQLSLACSPASIWIPADRRNPLIPRTTTRFSTLYRGRGAVERTFGRMKHDAGLTPLRLRGIEKVALHADLCILATLAQALARARAQPIAA